MQLQTFDCIYYMKIFRMIVDDLICDDRPTNAVTFLMVVDRDSDIIDRYSLCNSQIIDDERQHRQVEISDDIMSIAMRYHQLSRITNIIK